MITFHLTANDLLDIRFGYSPILELALSYRLLFWPQKRRILQRWTQAASHALQKEKFPYLDALVQPAIIADFITPVPGAAVQSIEDEIVHLRNTPTPRIREQVLDVIALCGDSEIRQAYLAHPRQSLQALIEEMRRYWQRALLPHWPQITAILEGDVLYRARRMAVHGTDGMFEDLHPRISFHQNRIVLSKNKPGNLDIPLNGTGLQLVPALFACPGALWQIEEDSPSMLVYVARGIGAWQQEDPEGPDQSLELALGAGRARVLQTLSTPSNTGEVARRLEISSGAVSQHLNRLRSAGLVEPHRSGKRVFYHLTSRGQQLLALFGA